MPNFGPGIRIKRKRTRAEFSPARAVTDAFTVDNLADRYDATATGAGKVVTLPDGNYQGQQVMLYKATAVGTFVVTAGAAIHLANSIATITLPATAHAYILLEWNGSAWAVSDNSLCTFT